MKSFAICALFAAGASAIPMAAPMHAHLHHKRDTVWVTETDVDIVTDIVTKTVWVGGSSSTPAAYSAPAYTSASSVASSSAAAASSSSSAPVVPVQSSSSSSSVYVAPTTTSTSTSAYVAPTTTTTPAYVAPTTTTTSAYTPPTTTAYTTSAAASTSYSASATPTSSSGGAGGTYVGALSYYDVGLGSCGNTNTDSEDVVAMDEDMMDKATMCGKMISITANGVTVPAQVVDTCPGCRGNAGLDLSPSLFAKFAPTASGIVPSATWSFM